MREMLQRPDTLWDAPRLASPHTQADKAARVRRMFDGIAPTYELVNRLASAGRDRYWRREMVRLAALRPDDILLDIACGTGDVARAFAAATTPPQQILGLDFSLPMLAVAAATDQRAPRDTAGPRTAFCQADALHLPLPDASVSITTCAFGIRNFQDLPRGLGEMHRVLRPGGRTVILEFTVPQRPLLRRIYLFYLQHLLPRLAALVSRDRSGAYRYLPSSVVSFASGEAICASLRAAGFTSVSSIALTCGIVSIYVGVKASGPGS